MRSKIKEVAIYQYKPMSWAPEESDLKELKEQHLKCAFFGYTQNMRLPGTRIYRDFDCSLPVAVRPGLADLMTTINRGLTYSYGQIHAVFIAGLAHIAEDKEDALSIVHGIESLGIEVIIMENHPELRTAVRTPAGY